ncbi:MAG: GTP 3',8-cyclase MoaA [Dehalococcoidales bacterium]|nr:GTP 3',8-cyclase MoaA [Dehalococcoidales bacterium]
MACLRDGFNRPIQYLRVSVTDRCNFRCFYCMPQQGVQNRRHSEILTYEEIALIVRAAAGLGLSKVRITGGEPLVRLGIVDLVRMLAEIPGIDDLAMTTNGFLLATHARALKEAGLRRVNVSLDTLKPDRFARITGAPALKRVIAGIEEAREAGLRPIKINVVALRGVNDDELADFAAVTIEKEWNVRFIELMPLGQTAAWGSGSYLPVDEIKEIIGALGPLEPDAPDEPKPDAADQRGEPERSALPTTIGPARYCRLPGAKGTIGFISPVSDHFCFNCNRLRLTADGRLRPCLLWEDEIDLRTPLREGATLEDVKGLLTHAAAIKPEGHRLSERIVPVGRVMSEIGG